MLTNFLLALVQSWDSASGQMALVSSTVWLSKGDHGVCVCVCVCVCIQDCLRKLEYCDKVLYFL